ncbi:MAG: elongation factor G [Bacteroidales bacterium]|jgi:elongation factor G|nr:elongation factor G [Bacteroidales bacterium]MDN5349836.1 elongation factor [Bacteroidales bacterium]
MKVYQTDEIRNIALIGAAKSGKTTLAENMLFEGKVINRKGSVDDKNSVSDYRQIELDRQISVHLSLLYTLHEDKKINILDAPGFSDFAGDILAATTVADTSILIINGQAAVEATTENAWKLAERSNTPVVFFINHLDHHNANFDEAVRQIKDYFGDKATVAQYPVNTGEGFDSVIDLMLMKMLKFPQGGGAPEVLDIPAEEMEKAASLHKELVENAAEGDEELMEKYFENDTLSLEETRTGIRLGLVQRAIFPIMCGAVKHGIGVHRLMDFIVHSCPAPNNSKPIKTTAGKEYKCDVNDPAGLFVFKVANEQHLGEISMFKVYGGTITEGQDLINPRNEHKERISQLFVVNGKNREKVDKVIAGDIAVTIKLKDIRTNDSLMDPKFSDAGFSQIEFPDPIFTTAVKAVQSTDDEKLGSVLQDMHRTDPTIIAGLSRELRQLILQCQGEYHMNTIKWYLDHVHKLEVEFYSPKIPYRETITKAARADYRHKKQSGGSGQFGEVHLMVQPYFEGYKDPTDFPVRGKEEHNLSWGGKLIFANCIVGGSIDARFMPAILKGIMERMEEGPLTGSYARDIVVYIYDGKMHPVDSNEISFKLAGRHAFSDAFKNAGPKIMEPIYDVSVRIPEDMMGACMTDLQGRRAVIMGMDSDGKYQIINAKVPLAEMDKYSTSLSSITSGRGTYSMKFAEYAQVPGDVQTKLLKEYEESLKEEE